MSDIVARLGHVEQPPVAPYEPAEPFGLRDRMSTITALRSQRLRPL